MYTTQRRVASPNNHASRDQLVRHHLGLVYHVARQMKRITAGDTPIGEMVSAGTLGLMRAVEAFDPERGNAFSTYAAVCIRGAILDERRRCDPVSRLIRRKERRLQAGWDALSQSLGRRPNEGEMAHHMDLDMTTLWRWRADIHQANTVSLDQPVSDTDTNRGALGDLLIDDHSENAGPMAILQREEQVVLMRKAILKLKAQQQVVLALYYEEKLTLAQIGTIIKVTESRVSQIRAAALNALRIACAETPDPIV